MTGRPATRTILAVVAVLLVAAGLVILPFGCNRGPNSADGNKLRVGYIGLTCEAPIFVAFEKGYFKEEGLEVDFVKRDWSSLREGLTLDHHDAIQTLLMYMLKGIEQGAAVKITGGIHTGCLRLQVGVKSDIKSARDLKGKKIGVPTHLGSPPHMFASRVLVAHGIDPAAEKKEVTWVAIQEDALGIAIEKGQVDAIATSDPLGTILMGMGVVRTIADQAEDAPYKHEYCCVTVVSGKLARENPVAAAKFTRAMFKASKWVEENSTAAAKLAVDKDYTAASAEINAQALAKLHYVPGVAKCRTSIEQAAREMQKAGWLAATIDPDGLAKRAWQDLDGVTDDRIAALDVERVRDGGRPEVLSPFRFALLWERQKGRIGCCCGLDGN